MLNPLQGVSPRRACGDRKRSLISAGAGCLLAAAVLLATGTVYGQVTPLRDLVPLDEMETATDDLIRLATAHTDAVRELKNARLSLETLEKLQPNAVITRLEIQIARVNAQMAERKVQLVAAVVQRQLATAEARLQLLQRMETLGEKTPSTDVTSRHGVRIAYAEASVSILKMILETK